MVKILFLLYKGENILELSSLLNTESLFILFIVFNFFLELFDLSKFMLIFFLLFSVSSKSNALQFLFFSVRQFVKLLLGIK